MKVLQVVHCYLPTASAGAEVYTARLVRALREAGHPTSVFFAEKVPGRPDGSLLPHEHEGAPGQLFVNNLMYRRFEQTWSNPAAERAFEQVLDRERPDLVHVQHLMGLSLGLLARARARGLPIVMTLHDFWLHCPRMGQLLNERGALCEGPEPARCAGCLRGYKLGQTPAQRRVLRLLSGLRRATGLDLSSWVARARRRPVAASAPGLAVAASAAPATHLAPAPEELIERGEAVRAALSVVDRFLIPSATVRDRSVDYGLPADRCELLPYGFLPPGPRPKRPARSGPLRLAFVGTIRPHKGAHVLVEAFARAGLEDAELIVYGDAEADPAYTRRLRELAGDAAVRFAGRLPNPEVPRAIAEADVLVVPSIWLENAPVVIAEARWVGVPVLASRLGGMAEAVRDGVDGRLFEAGDVADLSRVLRELAADRSLLSRWSQAAAPPFSMERHVARVLELYQQLQREGGRR